MIVKSMLVRIGADASAMKAALTKAGAGLKKHSAAFKKAGMAMTVAGGAITGAVGLMIKSYMSAGDEVHKMALRTGISTEALGELKYAAELGGTSLTGLEKGVRTMQKAIVQAGDGMVTYTRGFDRMGISVKDLEGLNPEQQFIKIANAVAEIEDPTVRSTAAQEIFGSRMGTQLLPMLADGAEAFAKTREEAHKMGNIFTQEAADKAAILTDSLTTLKGSFQGVSMSIANTLAPVITQIVEKISSVAQKIKDWMKEHPKLSGTIMKVVVVLGGLMAVLGPLVMILPALATGISLVSKALIKMKQKMIVAALSMGPLLIAIGLVIAAVATATIVFMKLKKAKDEVRKADERLIEAQKSLRQKLIDMKNAAGMTGEEFGILTNKYKGNIVAMTMAIHKGKEGEKLQKALADVSKKHKEEIDKQREGYEKIVLKIEDYKVKLQEVPGIVKAMTDEISKATLSEYEYAKETLKQKKLDRDDAITKELEDGLARQEALSLNEEAYRLAMKTLDEDEKEKEKERYKESHEAYLTAKDELTDSIKQLTLSEHDYTLWALKDEYDKKVQTTKDIITDEKERNIALELLRKKHLLDMAKAEEDHAEEMTQLQTNTMGALTTLYGGFIDDTLDAFSDWGAGTGNLLKDVGKAFGNLAMGAIEALKDIVKQEIISAATSFIKNKAIAISRVIASVMALPFPFNVLAAGGAIAAVTLLFSKIKLFKEGGFVPKQTLAILHPGEYVVPAPAVKALSQPGAGIGGGIVITQKNYFYGNISNVGDLDEISKRLAQRTRRAIERGRR